MKNVLLFLGAGVLLIPAFKVFGQEALAPVYKEGECWVFRSVSKNYQGYVSGDLALPVNGEHKICFLERKFFEIDGATKSQISTGSVWNNILYMRENRYLKFPLIVGQKRTEAFETRIRGTNRVQRGTAESSVLGIEDITSSAGAYQTFKIETNHWCGGKSCGRYIYFYSPQTKERRKIQLRSDIGQHLQPGKLILSSSCRFNRIEKLEIELFSPSVSIVIFLS